MILLDLRPERTINVLNDSEDFAIIIFEDDSVVYITKFISLNNSICGWCLTWS